MLWLFALAWSRRVAVVGGGVAGATTAHFLRERGIEAVVFEAGDRWGGRMFTSKFANTTIDVGATAIFSKNQYMLQFTKGMPRGGRTETGHSLLTVWDGSKVRIALDLSAPSWQMAARIAGRYGISARKAIPVVNEVVDKFDAIYGRQARNESFDSPEALLGSLGLLNETQQSGYDFFAQRGIPRAFVDELVDGASRCNYNQPGTINALADSVSLAGAGVAGTVFSLAGGTQAVVEKLVPPGSLLGARVSRAEPVGHRWRVEAEQGGGEFDAVVIATPLERADVALPPEAVAKAAASREYQTTVATFVRGRVRPDFAAKPWPWSKAQIPDAVLTPEDSSSAISSFGRLRTLPDGSVVAKLFSRRQLNASDFGEIFASVEDVAVHSWKAYPKLPPRPLSAWPSFKLAPGLFYASALETAASAMEIGAIAGKNAALLVEKHLAAVKEPFQPAILI